MPETNQWLLNWVYQYEGPPAEVILTCRPIIRDGPQMRAMEVRSTVGAVGFVEGTAKGGYLAFRTSSVPAVDGYALQVVLQCDHERTTLVLPTTRPLYTGCNNNAAGRLALSQPFELARVGFFYRESAGRFSGPDGAGVDACDVVFSVTVEFRPKTAQR